MLAHVVLYPSVVSVAASGPSHSALPSAAAGGSDATRSRGRAAAERIEINLLHPSAVFIPGLASSKRGIYRLSVSKLADAKNLAGLTASSADGVPCHSGSGSAGRVKFG